MITEAALLCFLVSAESVDDDPTSVIDSFVNKDACDECIWLVFGEWSEFGDCCLLSMLKPDLKSGTGN